MGQTTSSNALIPDIFEQTVRSAFASKTAFAGSRASSLGIVMVRDNFPVPYANADSIGQTINVPYFSSIGEFQDAVSDGTAATTVALTQTKESATVQRGTLGFEVTRWANSNAAAQGGNSMYDEAASQCLASAERYMDKKIIAAAVAGNNQLVLDKYSATVPRNFDIDLMLDGLGMWGDFGDLNEVAAMAVHSKTMIDILKLKDADGKPLLIQPNAADAPPLLFGKPLIVSDRLPVDNSGLSAVTTTNTTGTPPVVTLTQTANREGGTGPVRPIDLVIKCTTVGALATWKFKVSIDGGATYGADNQYTSAATVALTDPLDPSGGLLGVTVAIAAGTAALDHQFAAKSVLKHTSLILKKNALLFWYARSAMGLQTIPVPLSDSIVGATHMYCAAYRYQRMNGSPYPGVVKIRHNAGGL